MVSYYKHIDGCGESISLIKINDDDVTLMLGHLWMGDDRNGKYIFTGKLFLIEDQYSIIKFTTCQRDNVINDELEICFDLYILNNEIRSEWGKYPPNDIPIGLYAGNSCMSTTKFKLVMYINYNVINDCDKYKFLITIKNSWENL